MFVWKNAKGAELVVMYHHGYGGIAHPPGAGFAIAIVVRGDNSGPHTPEEIAKTYDDLGRLFPGARIVPTTLTEIANAVAPYKNGLPVITQEIGDSWIHGVPSDPLKVARFWEIARLREFWISQGKLQVGDAADTAMLRRVLLGREHTWGADTKTWLDFDHYTPADLTSMLGTKNYKVVAFSWAEKRQNLFDGIATLSAPLREQAETSLHALEAKVPQMPAVALHPAGKEIEECISSSES